MISLFGCYCAFSRRIEDIFLYIMVSLSYTVSLLMKNGLDDISCIINYEKQAYSLSMTRTIRFSLGFFMITQCTLAYFMRDSLLIGDNYYLHKNLPQLDLLTELNIELLQRNSISPCVIPQNLTENSLENPSKLQSQQVSIIPDLVWFD